MAIVIDASVVLAALLDEDHALQAEQILTQDLVCAPRLLRLEVTNGLVSGVRRNRLSASDGAALAQAFEALPIAFDDQLAEASALFDFAQTHGLTTYDAAYLQLAQRMNAPIATFDEAMVRVAKSLGVTVLAGDLGSAA